MQIVTLNERCDLIFGLNSMNAKLNITPTLSDYIKDYLRSWSVLLKISQFPWKQLNERTKTSVV